MDSQPDDSRYVSGGGVDVQVADGALQIVIDRPERRGALTPDAIAVMITALEQASVDDHLRSITITSTGEHFCAGADWVATNRNAAPPRPGNLQRRTALRAHRLIALLLEVQLPVVCRVQGTAAGLG